MKSVFSVHVLPGLLMLCSSLAALEDPLDPEAIRKIEGFRVELLRAAQPGEDSWISMSLDAQNRILLGLDEKGVARITLLENGKSGFERLDSTLKHCRGVLFAFNDIYVNSTDSQLLVRLRDLDQDGHYETVEKLIQFDYRSRYGHGANQMRLGPDGMIYVVVGNDVAFPGETLDTSPYRDPRNDWLLPETRDLGQDSRVGYILRMDREGNQREIVAGGFRNPVDMDFDPNGEMFTFDADMEWDIGAPWYRPIRINHIVSGGEYGWRWGTGKWPAYYPDSLPSNLDVGLGSPTGVLSGAPGKFPDRYRRALFVADWQNGRILAAFPRPNGASYSFEYESFLDGAPLNVCDMEFGTDGKLYFITGGRGSQSALYRVSWTGPVSDNYVFPSLTHEQIRRREIEKFHLTENREAIDSIWNDLGHSDAWIRHAARVALERQSVELWEKRVLSEQEFSIALTGLLALVRQKSPASSPSDFREVVVGRLLELVRQKEKKESTLSTGQLLGVIRICGILCARHGRPEENVSRELFQILAPRFPAKAEPLNCELCELLVYLGAQASPQEWRDFRDQAFLLLQPSSTSQETQIHLARSLAHAAQPWPRQHLRQYANWLIHAQNFRGGHLLPGTLVQMQTDFVATLANASLPEEWKAEISDQLQNTSSSKKSTVPADSGRSLVRNWTLDDFEQTEWTAGDPERGRQVFLQAQCGNCHRQGDLGSLVGPDLTHVGKRFDRTALLESILVPSRQIDPKYALSTYSTIDGRTYTGRVHGVSADSLTLETDPILQKTIQIKRNEIEFTKPAKTSPMPTGLLDPFSKNEIIDLISFLTGKQ